MDYHRRRVKGYHLLVRVEAKKAQTFTYRPRTEAAISHRVLHRVGSYCLAGQDLQVSQPPCLDQAFHSTPSCE